MNEQNVCFARAYGEPREVGAEIGRQMADEIMDVIAAVGVPEGLPACGWECCGLKPEMLLRNIEAQAPELLAEMDGLADGAGMPGASILLLNWMMQLWSVKALALGFADGPGGPAIAMALAAKEAVAVPVAVTAIDVPGKAEVLQIGAPGLVGCVAGVNSHGIGLAVTPAAGEDSREDGMPSLLVARKVLQDARTLEEALEILAAAKVACCPFDAIVGDKEKIVGVERGVTEMKTREAVAGVVLAGDLSVSLVGELASLADVLAFFQDRVANEAFLGDSVVFGAVLRPRARVIQLAADDPHKAQFRPFQLKLAVTGAGSHLAGEYQQ